MELTTFRTIAVPPVLSAATAAALASAVANGLADGAVRGLVLNGDTGAFCRGMDLAGIGDDADAVDDSLRLFAQALGSLAQADKPTVAVVRGPALGGGVGIAAACDLVLSARSATFGLPEALFGLSPAIIAPILLERVTPAALRRLVLTAATLSADDAKAIGLVDEVIDEVGQVDANGATIGALDARLRRLCATLPRVDPRAKGVLVEAVRHHRSGPLASALDWGSKETLQAARSPEVADRVRRFLEGGAPWDS
jgi:enoyl-CoA hydratase/carnithine racemase